MKLVNGKPVNETQADIDQQAIDAIIPKATVLQVKTEAGRRILEQYPDWKQRNMNKRATELLQIKIDNGSWTIEEQSEADALKAVSDWVDSVRAASDTIEADPPDLPDLQTDNRWPANPA